MRVKAAAGEHAPRLPSCRQPTEKRQRVFGASVLVADPGQALLEEWAQVGILRVDGAIDRVHVFDIDVHSVQTCIHHDRQPDAPVLGGDERANRIDHSLRRSGSQQSTKRVRHDLAIDAAIPKADQDLAG